MDSGDGSDEFGPSGRAHSGETAQGASSHRAVGDAGEKAR
jgi:hypothetical protein